MMLNNFIGGRWIGANAAKTVPVHNPSTGEVIAETPLSSAVDVDNAVAAANHAFAHWRRTPPPKRAAVMFRYRELLEQQFEELARLVTRENGKTQEEARGDVRRGIEVVEFACGIAHLLKGESLPHVAEQLDAVTIREPLGVCAGITPFNFPAMVPMWMYPIAIACGNTFILKPSEKVPQTAMRLAELMADAGLPDGVLNLVHGGADVVNGLCSHPDIAAVSFVGSSTVARHVYTLGCRNGKRVQAAGGAKNVLLVMPDAEPDSTLRAIIGSSFGCAGQRCMAGSVLMGVGKKTADEWRERVVDAIDAFCVGDTNVDLQADMGPVIDGAAQKRVQSYLTAAPAEGASVVFDGSSRAPQQGYFVGPALVDEVAPNMKLFQDEVFGPVLSLVRPESLSDAIAMMNGLRFGNGATIFTSSGAAAHKFVSEMQSGMIGVNVGVPAPMSLFSFSGWNDSFYGDLHVQGMEGVMFYTRQKCVLSRWDASYERAMGW
ncbi:MAG: CoA-acylating methylmalonate-semialdehyde dehydrogenase [Planctomycetaceae bacterium]|nr:CoA-acylating methylmalonate-semialdehyde dehydrogenase [Planctomycetales bacterium]MCB9922946.1 CoA-acylating methylmalonate-semialdehyde dehydrogenase [Planctomycetaceae bacterium]